MLTKQLEAKEDPVDDLTYSIQTVQHLAVTTA